MMDRFKASEENSTRVPQEVLRATVREIFTKSGVRGQDAETATDVLVTADLRGVDSHGVSNALRGYVRGFADGELNPTPDWKVVRETPGTANVDSDGGLGIMVAPRAMEIAIEKAKNVGVGTVTIHNSRHLGMISYHAMIAMPHDMIGTTMSSCPENVNPTFGAEPRLGTNPIAVAAPAGNEAPFVFDAAMSVVPANRLVWANRLEQPLMPGWIAADDGTPIMEPVAPPALGDDGIPLANILPLGSTLELGSHKGYGLMSIVDIFGGLLSGGGYGVKPCRPVFNHYVAAYNIEAFTDVADFKVMMDEWLNMLMDTKPAAGHDKVLYAGLKESKTVADRIANGIPLHEEVLEWFESICSKLGIDYALT